jgi:hypothetical protein
MYKIFLEKLQNQVTYYNTLTKNVDLSKFPQNFSCYVEEVDGDWWVEKIPFELNGREKDEELKNSLILPILNELAKDPEVSEFLENEVFYIQAMINSLDKEIEMLKKRLYKNKGE